MAYTFKDKLQSDLDNVFLNPDEFGELHEIEGNEVICVFDDMTLSERTGGSELIMSQSSILLYAKTTDLPPRRGYGESLLVDSVDYMVVRWDEDMGMSSITLTIAQ